MNSWLHSNCWFLFLFFFLFFSLLYSLFFFFNLFIYWLCWVFVSVRGLSLVAASGGHSSSRCAGLSLSWPLLLRSTGSRRAGSVVVARGLSCSTACGIFPDQGWNLCPLHWQADSQPLRHQGSPYIVLIVRKIKWALELEDEGSSLDIWCLLRSPRSFYWWDSEHRCQKTHYIWITTHLHYQEESRVIGIKLLTWAMWHWVSYSPLSPSISWSENTEIITPSLVYYYRDYMKWFW